MSQIVQVNGTNYTIPDFGDPPPWNQTPLLVALGAAVASNPSFLEIVNVSTSPISVTSGKTYLVNSTSLAITLTLPTAVSNLYFFVKDVGFNAYTNNITIARAGSESIEGVAGNLVLRSSGGYWGFVCNGTNWFVLMNNASPLYDYVSLGAGKGDVYTSPNGSVRARQSVDDFGLPTTEVLA